MFALFARFQYLKTIFQFIFKIASNQYYKNNKKLNIKAIFHQKKMKKILKLNRNYLSVTKDQKTLKLNLFKNLAQLINNKSLD